MVVVVKDGRGESRALYAERLTWLGCVRSVSPKQANKGSHCSAAKERRPPASYGYSPRVAMCTEGHGSLAWRSL